MLGKAVAIYEDNGECICVDLPAEQELLDRIHKLERQVEKWKTRHDSAGQSLALSTFVNIALMLGIFVSWWLS